MGSRLEADFAKRTGANFLTTFALASVIHRLDRRQYQKWQAISRERLWCDLLSSMPMCFNLLGPLWADDEARERDRQSLVPEHMSRERGGHSSVRMVAGSARCTLARGPDSLRCRSAHRGRRRTPAGQNRDEIPRGADRHAGLNEEARAALHARDAAALHRSYPGRRSSSHTARGKR